MPIWIALAAGAFGFVLVFNPFGLAERIARIIVVSRGWLDRRGSEEDRISSNMLWNRFMGAFILGWAVLALLTGR